MNKFKIADSTGNSLGVLETWFPKTIFRAEQLLSTEYLEAISKVTKYVVNQDTERCTAFNVDSTHNTNNLISYKEYDFLKTEILKRAQGFGEALGFCSRTQMQNLRISNMWANKSTHGDFIFPHVHPHSNFSGVFYIEAPENSIITFYDNIYNMSPEPKYLNVFTGKYTQYPCTVNSMLLFKSDLLHGNEKQPVGNKLAISFNIVF